MFLSMLCDLVYHQFTTLPSVSIPKSLCLIKSKRILLLEKMKGLHDNKTYELISLARGKHVVGYRCVCTIKCRLNWIVQSLKVRLVAKGMLINKQITLRLPPRQQSSTLFDQLYWQLLARFDILVETNEISDWFRPRSVPKSS